MSIQILRWLNIGLLAAVFVCGNSQSAYAQCEPTVVHELFPEDDERYYFVGYSVGISENIAVVAGGYYTDHRIYATYLFDTVTGEQVHKFIVGNETFLDQAVAIDGNTVIVGVHGVNQDGIYTSTAYLFNATSGEMIAELWSDDVNWDAFGRTVGISGNTAIVGAPAHIYKGEVSGGAYLYDAATGDLIKTLHSNDQAAGDNFGVAVAISGTTAIVGASGDDDNGDRSGSAYLFDAKTGQQIAKLLPVDGAELDWFGRSVAINGTTAIVGATSDDDNGENSGSAYLFDTTTGQQVAKLLPDDGDVDDGFGSAVAISGTIAVVGAYANDDYGDRSGSVYLFDLTTGQQITKLTPKESDPLDYFGFSVAIKENLLIIGAWGDDDNGPNYGTAYVYDINCSSGTVAELTSFRVETGILIDGTLPNLVTSDDTYIHTRSGFGQTLVDLHHMEIIVSAVTSVDAPIILDLKIESRIDEPSGLAQIRIRNWNTNQFESVGSYSIGNTDQVDLINSIDATNFIDGSGNIDLSIKHLVFVPFLAFTFELFIDQVEIVVE